MDLDTKSFNAGAVTVGGLFLYIVCAHVYRTNTQHPYALSPRVRSQAAAKVNVRDYPYITRQTMYQSRSHLVQVTYMLPEDEVLLHLLLCQL